MAPSTDSKERATVWLKPAQVESMRTAIVRKSSTKLKQRNDALIQLLYDTGLRVGEIVQVDVEYLDLEAGVLSLPPDIQKDYPTERSPSFTRIDLDDETVRILDQYLGSRWTDPTALFPSTHSSRMTPQSLRNVVDQAAHSAGIEPHTTRGRGKPSDVTPHTLRHSVAFRMLNAENGNTLYDVRNRLRHSSILTTERIYDHFDRV